MTEESPANAPTLPSALWVWNNKARTSLPPGLMCWLAVLVATCLASALFVRDHASARWVLGGFVVSHLLVFTLPLAKLFVMRRGVVSLLHLLCWSPGWVATLVAVWRQEGGALFLGWSVALLVVMGISFVFDLRDAGVYVGYAVRGKLPTG